MRKFPHPHPGEILMHEFLEPMGISQYRLAKEIGVPQRRIGEIVAGRRAITVDTGLRLSRFFGMSEGFWTGLQLDYEVAAAKVALASELERIKPWAMERRESQSMQEAILAGYSDLTAGRVFESSGDFRSDMTILDRIAEIEAGRTSGIGKPASDVFDRLEAKYKGMVSDEFTP